MTARSMPMGFHPAVPSELPLPSVPPEIPADAVKAELQKMISGSLHRVMAGMAGLFAILAVAQKFFASALPAQLPIFSSAIAVVCAFSAVLTWKFKLPGRWAHPFCTFIAGLILVAQLLQLYVTREPWQTSHLILLILAVSSLFLALDWFLLFAGVALVSWSTLAFVLFPQVWIHYTLALGLSVSLGFLIQTVRVRTIQNLESLKLQHAAHRKFLMESIENARKAEKRFQLLADATGEAVIIHAGGRIIDANAAASRLFGFTVAELGEKPITDLISPDYHHVMKCNTTALQSAPINIYAVRANRSLFPVLLGNSSVLLDGQEVTVSSIRDNSSSKRAEEAAVYEQLRIKKKLKRHETLAAAALSCNQYSSFMEAAEQLLLVANREFAVSLGSVILGKGLQDGFAVIASTLPELKTGSQLRYANSPRNLLRILVQQPEPLFLSDLCEASFEVETLFPAIKPKALAAIPLVKQGKLLAVVICFEESTRKYDKEDSDFLSGVAATLLGLKF